MIVWGYCIRGKQNAFVPFWNSNNSHGGLDFLIHAIAQFHETAITHGSTVDYADSQAPHTAF